MRPMKGLPTTRDVDPDSHGSALKLVFWIWSQIRIKISPGFGSALNLMRVHIHAHDINFHLVEGIYGVIPVADSLKGPCHEIEMG